MDPTAFRTSLTRIGFSVPAAAYIVAPAALDKEFCSKTLSISLMKTLLHFVLRFAAPAA